MEKLHNFILKSSLTHAAFFGMGNRTGRRDSTTGALIPPEVDLHGAATTAQRPADDTAARVEHEAKLHGAGLGGEGHVEGEGVSDFVFDLDLNPDM